MPKINLIKFDDDDQNSSENNDMLVDYDENSLHNNRKNLRMLNIEQTQEIVRNKVIRTKNSRHNSNINKSKPSKNYTKKNRKTHKKSKKSSLLKKFLLAFFISILFFIFLIVGIFYAFDKIFAPENPNITEFDNDNSKYVSNDVKDRYNFAIFGVDNESPINPRTDFMMIGSYDKINNKVRFMSIPRDTLVYMPQERIDYLNDNDVPMIFPSTGKMKLNEVNHFATDEYGTSFLLAQLEEMFQIDFDFYVKFELDGFKYLVDAIGGVPFYVPQRMYYNDPTQDLYVDLQAGYQVLNGDQAEGVVRYRKSDEQNPVSNSYARGDLDRIEVQQDFIKAFVEQLTSLENLTSTLPAILQTASKYCETNFNLTDLPVFLPFLTNYSEDNIELYTMPNDVDGGYVTVKEPDTSELIDYIFYSDEDIEPISSIGLDIEILNGTYTSGLAGQAKEILEEDGFTVTSIGDNDKKLDQTRIYVKNQSYGQDLKPYFNTPKIVFDPSISSDIKIILGSSGS